jgi:transcriptional regulator with XRE-family HTH domain
MRRKTQAREAQYERPLYREVIGRIAANIGCLRAARGWTQEEAAFRCDGMATYVFQCVEAAKTNITATTIARLADGFGVDPQDLLAPLPPPPRRKPGRPRRVEPT